MSVEVVTVGVVSGEYFVDSWASERNPMDRYTPPTRERRAELRKQQESSDVQRLMPLYYQDKLGLLDWPEDDEEEYLALCEQMTAEELAYGEHLLDQGISHDGMFHRRCTAAAMRQQNEWQAVCDAIATMNINELIQGFGKWQQQ